MKYIIISLFLILSTVIYSNELKNYEFTYQDEDLIIAFTLDEETKTEIFNLKNPFRLVLTIKGSTLGSNIKPKNDINNEILKSIMAVQYSRNGKKNTKLIISLKKEVAYTIDTFNNRILLILKNVKTSKEDQIAKQIEENEKKIIETPQKVTLKNMVNSINYQYLDEDLIISIKTNKPTTYKSFELVSPFRIFFDINNVELGSELKKEIKYNDEYLQKALLSKMSRNGKSKVRISLFFKDKRQYSIEHINNNIILTVKGAKTFKRVAVVNTEAKAPIEQPKVNEKLIDYSYNDNSLLIAIKLKSDEEIKNYHLTEPFRIILDIKNTSFFNENKKEFSYNDNYLKNIKFIKYKRNGEFNSKIIISFNKYAPYEVEKINKTILITLSNIINPQNINNNVYTAKEKINEIKKPEEPEETISFKKTNTLTPVRESKKEKKAISKAPVIKTQSSNISSNKHNLLSKVIFKKHNKRARIIIRTKNPASYQTELEGKVFTIILNNASFASRMSSLTLNTEFFKTNVNKVIPKRKGKNIVIKMILSKSKTPEIKQSKNELFFDF